MSQNKNKNYSNRTSAITTISIFCLLKFPINATIIHYHVWLETQSTEQISKIEKLSRYIYYNIWTWLNIMQHNIWFFFILNVKIVIIWLSFFSSFMHNENKAFESIKVLIIIYTKLVLLNKVKFPRHEKRKYFIYICVCIHEYVYRSFIFFH